MGFDQATPTFSTWAVEKAHGAVMGVLWKGKVEVIDAKDLHVLIQNSNINFNRMDIDLILIRLQQKQVKYMTIPRLLTLIQPCILRY